MKCSLAISNTLEEISILSHSIVLLNVLHFTRPGELLMPAALRKGPVTYIAVINSKRNRLSRNQLQQVNLPNALQGKYKKQINNKVQLHRTGKYIQHPIIKHNGKECKKNIYA